MSHASVGKPIGSSNVPLVQEAIAPFALLINIAPGVALAVDVTDRAGRLLGIVYGENDQLQQLTPADAVAPNESLEVTGFNMVYDAVADDWNRVREGAAIGQVLVDLADRAARLVGIVYGENAQLQQSAPADAHANPADALEVGSFPHVYDPVADDWNRLREGAVIGQALVDLADRAARLVGIVYGEADQLQQSAPADAHANPADALEVGGFPHVWDPVGGDWNMWREGAAIGQGLVDLADRAGRLVGIVYGNLAQIQQLAALGDGVTPANTLESTGFQYVYNGATWDMVREGSVAGSVIVEDTGVNTNPRAYEKINGFYSAPTTRAGGVATAMWTIATTPARTAGEESTIYQFHIENSTGAAVTAWLEVGGVVVTPPYHVADDDTVTISWPAGLDIGNQDIDLNASVNDVVGQVSGTEV